MVPTSSASYLGLVRPHDVLAEDVERLLERFEAGVRARRATAREHCRPGGRHGRRRRPDLLEPIAVAVLGGHELGRERRLERLERRLDGAILPTSRATSGQLRNDARNGMGGKTHPSHDGVMVARARRQPQIIAFARTEPFGPKWLGVDRAAVHPLQHLARAAP